MARIPAEESEQVYEAMLRAAVEEIGAHGYAGMRIQAVAKRVNRTTGAVYGRFANKEELALAALRHLRDQMLMPRLATALAKVGSPVEALEALSGTLARLADEVPSGQLMVARLALETARDDTELAGELRAMFAHFAGAIEGWVREAQALGLARPDVDAHRFAHAAVGLPVSFMAVAQMFPDKTSYQQMEDTLRGVLTRGISAAATEDGSTRD